MLSSSDFDITQAIQLLNNFSIEASFIVPTPVGLEKSIMDATAPLRAYLKSNKIHNYDGQLQGPEGKKIIPAFFITESGLIQTTASLYRPKAKGKSGDPRIWFSNLRSYALANNLLAIIAFDNALYILNISNKNIREKTADSFNFVNKLLKKISSPKTSTADELLEKIKEIASRGWIKTVTPGDTGIGVTLESCLGIAINSSRKPDYKGIEIKASRLKGFRPRTRNTLFAQVPDWNLSKLKSSAQILDKYGYYKGTSKKLYCTVKSSTPNPQGLMLSIDESNDLLNEVYKFENKIENVVTWKFDILRERLITKHNETFWVGAESQIINGLEHFQYKKVIHTKKPYASNFHTLCHEGIITLDHLISKDESGKVKEKGPLFKINQSHFNLLFPSPIVFDLIS